MLSEETAVFMAPTGGRGLETALGHVERHPAVVINPPPELPATASLHAPYERMLFLTLVRSAALAGRGTSLFYELPEFRPGGGFLVDLLQEGQPTVSRTAFASEFARLLDEDPVTVGESHASESWLGSLDRELGQWMLAFYDASPDHRRSVALLVGRLPAHLVGRTSVEALLRRALSDRSVGVREAAVRACETLGPTGFRLLRDHDESVGWLKSYVDQVKADLEGVG